MISNSRTAPLKLTSRPALGKQTYDFCKTIVTGMPSMSPVRVNVLPCIA